MGRLRCLQPYHISMIGWCTEVMCCCHFIDRPDDISGVTDIVNMVAWCLSMVGRARWDMQNIDSALVYFDGKFNSKAGLFSSTFWFEHSSKECRTCLFYAFSTFGWVLSQFWKIVISGPFWSRFYCYMAEKLKVPNGVLKSKSWRKQTSFRIKFPVQIQV